MYNFETPWGWYKCIETWRCDYNINIYQIKNIYCALLVELKPIYKMQGTYIKIALMSSRDILAIHWDASEANPTIKVIEDDA